MELHKKHEKLATAHQEAKYRFILTELDLALTFCEMAMTSDDQAKTIRNTENAQRAYLAATHFLASAGFSEEVKADVHQKVARLETTLEKLNGRTLRLRHLSPGKHS